MGITYETVKELTAQLYDWSLRKVPDETQAVLAKAAERETNEIGRRTLRIMLESAKAAQEHNHFVCSDSGVPVYFIEVGTDVRLPSRFQAAITDGFADLVKTIDPPLLTHVTNPLTNERGYEGKGMPIVSYDLVDGADYIDITCSPKALGSGRWAALEIFSFPNHETIEKFVLDTVLKAGSQPCPPVVIGVGIGGTFDVAAKLSKKATLRPCDSLNSDPILQKMEARLFEAINKTGFGPMGTGGDTTAMAVHIESSAGHGFTPVAVSFNCWINRRTKARIYNDGRIERLE
ncbi:MAG TPA: fumarate hydratase [Eoetvoesiella sp.]